MLFRVCYVTYDRIKFTSQMMDDLLKVIDLRNSIPDSWVERYNFAIAEWEEIEIGGGFL